MTMGWCECGNAHDVDSELIAGELMCGDCVDGFRADQEWEADIARENEAFDAREKAA